MPWQLARYAVLHGGLTRLVFNTFGLLIGFAIVFPQRKIVLLPLRSPMPARIS